MFLDLRRGIHNLKLYSIFFELKTLWIWENILCLQKITCVILQLLYKEIYAETNNNNARSNYRNYL